MIVQLKFEDMVSRFQEFFGEKYKKDLIKASHEKIPLVIDWEKLEKYDTELADALLENPSEIFKAMVEAITNTAKGEITEEEEQAAIRIRITNIPQSHVINIRDLRSAHLGRFLGVKGIIKQASEVRPEIIEAIFQCQLCEETIMELQTAQKLRYPYRCPNCENKRAFNLISKKMIDIQKITVEESPDMIEGGAQPRKINVFLRDDLVDPKFQKKVIPGNKVLIIGTLNDAPIVLNGGGGESKRRDIYMDGNWLDPIELEFEEIEISPEDEKKIKELAKSPLVYDTLIKSIAPSIFGYEDVKEAIALQLFGGVRKVRSDGVMTRGDVHVFLVGDPGTAKSQILKYVSGLAPKARYVVGKSASGAGITATVVKDEFMKGWALEAGALVLCNRGLCAVDELDKMSPEDRVAMHEVMEQQCYVPTFEVTLSDGTTCQIGNLVDSLIEKNRDRIIKGRNCEILSVEELSVLTTDFMNIFPTKVNRVSRHVAPSTLVKITLQNGREVVVTPEHPCWVVRNGNIVTLSASAIKSGEFFPLPAEIPIHGQTQYFEQYQTEGRKDVFLPTKNSPELCSFLGYHISDGCYELNRGVKNGVQFWNNNSKLIDDYVRASKQLFGITPLMRQKGKQYIVRLISKDVANWLKTLDPTLLEKGSAKKIPDVIMKCKKSDISKLLRAIYDGDGSVSYQKRGGCRISLAAENYILACQVGDLLLRFGIQSSIYWDRNMKIYRVDIAGQQNIEKFYENIGFLAKAKEEKLRDYVMKSKTYRTITDIVPNVTEKARALFKMLGISERKTIGHQIDRGVEKHRLFLQKLVSIIERRIQELTARPQGKYSLALDVAKKELEPLKKLAFGQIRWSKVKKIDIIPNKEFKWVYDVTVEPTRTFISNGMILHNTVTISKANIQATLNAQTTILAAANPKFGRFDPYGNIAEQIDLPPTLLNRFDLIFSLRDLPNVEKDTRMVRHVLKLHENPEFIEAPINSEFLRKYIAYAKANVSPKLTKPAEKEIERFYVTLRNRYAGEETPVIPVSPRQLEALIRLSEASARIRLSAKITEEDAARAIRLLTTCLQQVSVDIETGRFDIDKLESGITSTKRNKIRVVIQIVSSMQTESEDKTASIEDVIAEAEDQGIESADASKIINDLIQSGELFEPRRGRIRKV